MLQPMFMTQKHGKIWKCERPIDIEDPERKQNICGRSKRELVYGTSKYPSSYLHFFGYIYKFFFDELTNSFWWKNHYVHDNTPYKLYEQYRRKGGIWKCWKWLRRQCQRDGEDKSERRPNCPSFQLQKNLQNVSRDLWIFTNVYINKQVILIYHILLKIVPITWLTTA